jgi:hypothetical protein
LASNRLPEAAAESSALIIRSLDVLLSVEEQRRERIADDANLARISSALVRMDVWADDHWITGRAAVDLRDVGT